MNFRGRVTRNSNGSITIEPLDQGNIPGKIEQGTEIDITIDVVRTPAQMADAKRDRIAAGEAEAADLRARDEEDVHAAHQNDEPPRARTRRAAAPGKQ